MALSRCGIATDERERELQVHGSAGFPVAIYHDDILAEPVPWHWHDELEVAVVESGSCLIQTGTETVLANEGEAVFINGNVLHMCTAEEGCGQCMIQSIVFSPNLIGGERGSIFWDKYLNPLCRESGLRMLHLTGSTAWEKGAIQQMQLAWEAGAYEPESFEITVRNALSSCIALLAANRQSFSSGQPASDVKYESRIKQMLSFIHDHFAEEIDTRAIAMSANVSESEALRCFKRMLGTTPIQYLLTYRLERAESLLMTTNLMVSEVGERCGFQEMGYFAKAFRRQYGSSPKEYRQK